MGEEILGELGLDAVKYQAEHVIDHAKAAVHDVAQGQYLDAAGHAADAYIDSMPGIGLAHSAGEDVQNYVQGQFADASSDTAGYSSDASYADTSYADASSYSDTSADASYDTSSYDGSYETSSEYA